MSALWTAVTTSVITTGTLTALAWFLFRTWAGARIKGEVDTHYAKELEVHRATVRRQTDAELERLRSALEQERSLHAVATGAFASAQASAMERRLRAVEHVWDATVQTREKAGKLMLLLDILTREELAEAFTDPRVDSAVGHPTDAQMMDLLAAGAEVERALPFLDEPLAALFFGYRQLLGRIVAILKMGWERGRLQFWLDDIHTRRMLESLVSEAELHRIEQMRIGGIAEAKRIIEHQIVCAARVAVSSESASEAAYARARIVMERAREAELATAKGN